MKTSSIKNRFLQFVSVATLLAATSCQKAQEEILPQEETTNVEYSNARASASNPSITSIGGASMSGFTSNGTWLGNIPSCSRSPYLGFYVINTHDNNDNLNYWNINGTNFGTVRGSISSNSSGITFDIISWTNTVVQVRPKAGYQLDVKTNFTVTIRTSSNTTASRTINVIGMLANGRGYGQCTWEAAFQRKLMGLSIPFPSAYSTSGTINASYVPKKGDVLHWGKMHTGIILSTPTVSTSGGVTTYTFTIRERNSKCNETFATQSTQTFKKTSSTVTQGISSDNASLGKATTYWR